MTKNDINKYPQPFVKWVGGKRQLLSEIAGRMPVDYGTYFEPFVGGGALLFGLQPSRAVINDINPSLIGVYFAIRDNCDELIECLNCIDNESLVNPKAFYYSLRDDYNCRLVNNIQDIETSAMFIYLNKHCFNGLYRVNSKGLFNVPFNGSSSKSFNPENICAVSDYLKPVSILNTDFEIACKDAIEGDFIFFDSPYAPLNPASFESYTKDGFSLNEHKRLAVLFEELTERGCYCILTNHNTELINELYGKYRRDVVQVKRSINSDASNRKGEEIIVMNF